MINDFKVTPKTLLPPLLAVTARPELLLSLPPGHEHVTTTKQISSLNDLAALNSTLCRCAILYHANVC